MFRRPLRVPKPHNLQAVPCLVVRRFSLSTLHRCHPGGQVTDVSEDLFASLEKEHAKERRLRSMPSAVEFEKMILNTLPEEHRKTQAALQALREYFIRNKINEFIPCEAVKITGLDIDDPTQNVNFDKNKEYTIAEAISIAESCGCDLVMMAEREGTAYCKIKNERKRALQKIENLLQPVETSNRIHGNATTGKKLGPTEEYTFRDVIDSQAMQWKAKYIMQNLRKNRPVKLMCEKFSSPMNALGKLQDFLQRIQEACEPENVKYNAMQVNASERVFVALLQPTPNAKQIRHPNRNEWDTVMGRFKKAFDRSAREEIGTWKQRHKKVARSSGPTLYRTDKYGNRIHSASDNTFMHVSDEEMSRRRAAGMEALKKAGREKRDSY